MSGIAPHCRHLFACSSQPRYYRGGRPQNYNKRVVVAEEPTRKLAVLLHADVVGSTALVHLNETLAHQRIQDTFRRFSETIVSCNGIAHEVRGDALVAEFSKVSDAVAAALDFQNANATNNEELADEIRPVVRVGIAMGEVVVADKSQEDRVYSQCQIIDRTDRSTLARAARCSRICFTRGP